MREILSIFPALCLELDSVAGFLAPGQLPKIYNKLILIYFIKFKFYKISMLLEILAAELFIQKLNEMLTTNGILQKFL